MNRNLVGYCEECCYYVSVEEIATGYHFIRHVGAPGSLCPGGGDQCVDVCSAEDVLNDSLEDE